jgi:BirA family biotin operon repressor/biotin-[acetyl-CoA-carboxylase] ligase
MRDRDSDDRSRALGEAAPTDESPHFSAVSPDLAPDRLARFIAAAHPDSQFGAVYEPHGVCGSTNDICAQRARQGAPEGLVVLADQQSAGRGRLGRAWLSPAGQNLTFSLLLRPACAVTALPPLTLLAGVAVARVLSTLGLHPRLKWPNDILCDLSEGAAAGEARKVVGILTEMATQRDEVKHVVVGIGINVNQIEFAPEVATIASSLRALTGTSFDRAELLAKILIELESLYAHTLRNGAGAFLPAWRTFAQLPRPCVVQRSAGARGAGTEPGWSTDESTIAGTAVDVDEDGALLISNAAGVHRVLSGDVASL